MTPMDQTSTAFPYGFWASTSGAGRRRMRVGGGGRGEGGGRERGTDVSRRPAGGGHDPRVLCFGQAKVRNHDLGILVGVVVQQILGFQVPMNNLKSSSLPLVGLANE